MWSDLGAEADPVPLVAATDAEVGTVIAIHPATLGVAIVLAFCAGAVTAALTIWEGMR